MKTQHAKKTRERRVVVPQKRSHEEIAQLAYALYEREGKPDGKALEHWFNAESMTEGNFGYGKDHTEHDFSKEAGDE